MNQWTNSGNYTWNISWKYFGEKQYPCTKCDLIFAFFKKTFGMPLIQPHEGQFFLLSLWTFPHFLQIDWSSNSLLWVHLWRISVLLFSSLSGGHMAIAVFSLRHKPHLLDPDLYGVALALIDHFSFGVIPLLFQFKTYLLNAVPLLLLAGFMSVLCWIHISISRVGSLETVVHFVT